MIHLQEYFFESLSKENVKKIEEYINNDNVDEVIKILDKHFNNSLTDEDFKVFENILHTKKQFNKLVWPRKSSAVEYFSKLFDDKLDIFKNIIKEEGTISIKELPEHGNLFNYCKGFIDEAKTISSLTFPLGNTNSGRFEILLKLILKEGYTGNKGDVSIKGSKGGMEVKCHSKTKGNNGGRPFGQGPHYMKPWRIYQWLNKYLFKIGDDNDAADKSSYFQTNSDIKEFIEKTKDKDIDEVIKNIVNAVLYQYGLKIIKDDKKLLEPLTEKYYDQIIKSSKEYINGKFEKDYQITSLVECIQLCCYSIIEGFDYFIIPYIDVNEPDDNELRNSGKYFLIKDCQNINSILYNFTKINDYIKFRNVGGSTDDRHKAGEMFLKFNAISNK
jgi:hypothetical protein